MNRRGFLRALTAGAVAGWIGALPRQLGDEQAKAKTYGEVLMEEGIRKINAIQDALNQRIMGTDACVIIPEKHVQDVDFGGDGEPIEVSFISSIADRITEYGDAD